MKKFGDNQKAKVLKKDEAPEYIKETRKAAMKVKVWTDEKFSEVVSSSEDDREDAK